jgi:cytochrome oxidase assembly protein ShyY1
MYRFALRGRWLVGTILVLVIAALCVRLGFWQLERLDQRKARNALVEARATEDGGPLPADPEDALYRRVTVTGVYEPAREEIDGGRALGGRPGEHVITPLLLDDGRELLVNRGWLPNSGAPSDEAPAEAAPPEETVEVTGVVLPGDPDPVIRLERQEPPQPGDVPRALGGDAVETDEGPHLSYAVQWFLFASVALIGWPLLLRRQARQ